MRLTSDRSKLYDIGIVSNGMEGIESESNHTFEVELPAGLGSLNLDSKSIGISFHMSNGATGGTHNLTGKPWKSTSHLEQIVLEWGK
jgi:hypothetical protein